MLHWAYLRLGAALIAVLAICGAGKAAAQDMPSPFVQEVLIKSILVSLNDAVASDNFTVFHAFETTPKQVKYQLGFIPADGQWKLSGVTIDIE